MPAKTALSKKFAQTLVRFDLAIASCVTFCIFTLWQLGYTFEAANAAVFCGIPLFLSTRLWCENRKLSRFSYYILSISIFSVLSIYLYFSPPTIGTQLAFFSGLTLLFFMSPFIFNKSSPFDVWNFQFKLVKTGVFTGIIGFVLMVGIFAIMFGMEYLLNFNFYYPSHKVYIKIFIIIFTLICPLIFMSNIPSKFDFSLQKDEGKFIFYLIVYAVIPLLIIYSIILHIYAIKIFITQTLPKGMIAYLVSGYIISTLIAYIFSMRWKNDNKAVGIYHKILGWLMITPLSVMAWGIWERISTFGLTGGRYFISMLWIGFFISALLVIFYSKKANKWILGNFSFLLIIMNLGPWSIQELPVKHQIARLKETMVIVNNHPEKRNTLQIRVYVSTILDYLEQQKRLTDVYSAFNLPLPQQDTTLNNAKSVSNALNVRYISLSERQKASAGK